MALNNAVNLVPTISGTPGQIAVTQAAGSTTATLALTSPFFNSAQPLFSAYLSSTQSNVTGNNTPYIIPFDTELFDNANNYNPVTGIFTAPVTAKYLLVTNVKWQSGGSPSTNGQVQFRTGFLFPCFFNPLVAATTTFLWSGYAIVALNSGATARVELNSQGGTKTASVIGDGTQRVSTFSGYLLP